LRFFGRGHLALGTNPTSYFLAQVFLEIRLKSESVEPLIDFLAFLAHEDVACGLQKNTLHQSNHAIVLTREEQWCQHADTELI